MKCVVCGLDTNSGRGMCAHHDLGDSDWSASNRILCDLFHRRVEPARLPPADRDDAPLCVD